MTPPAFTAGGSPLAPCDHRSHSLPDKVLPDLLATAGGRLTTRRTTWKGLQFDHGCQFVRPTSDTFKSICHEWLSAGVIAPWEGKVVRYEAKTGNITDRSDYLQQQRQQQQPPQPPQQNETISTDPG